MTMNQPVRIIEVVDYNPKWKQNFGEEADRIKTVLGEQAIAIHHIGSTSIPGVCAKPIIDIMVEVQEISSIDNYNSAMEQLGYIVKGEFGIPSRRFFLKGLYNRTHHVHIFQSGSDHLARHLNFRDYMIAHHEDAKKYGDLKRALASEFRYDIEGYCNGKDAFIRDIDNKALIWAKSRNL
jgi:GrpB-like predicted nucleotidyltransferase (UPF0157 family)